MDRMKRQGRTVAVGAILACLVGAGLAAAPGADAGAPPTLLDVTTTEDVTDPGDGVRSLREAIDAANGSADVTIRLAEGAEYVLTDCDAIDDGRLRADGTGTVIIAGRDATIRQTCNAGVLALYGGPVQLRDLTLTDGDAQVCCGGGLDVIAPGETVLLDRVRLVDNRTDDGSGGGGAFIDAGSAIVRDSWIVANRATAGAGGGIRVEGDAELIRTTVERNEAPASTGGGVMLASGAITDSTVADNSASTAGAVQSFGEVRLRHATIVDNVGDPAVSVFDVTLGGTVIAGPPGGAELCNFFSSVSLGQNYSTTDCGLGAADVKNGPDPGLRRLFANGGFAPTAYLDEDSPLLDAVPAADPQLRPTDQRSLPRPGGPAGDIGALEVQPCGDRFTDVATGQPFCWEIGWLAAAGVTGGQVDGSFGALAPVTRASMAAFLYRLAGSPPYTPGPVATFPDVPVDHPFRAPVEWLAANGVIGGYGDGTFRPGEPVTRQSMAAFLHRLASSPAVDTSGGPTFPDVPPSATLYVPVEWLASTGITGGFGDGTFRPTQPVTRRSMAAFLYRYVDGQPILPA